MSIEPRSAMMASASSRPRGKDHAPHAFVGAAAFEFGPGFERDVRGFLPEETAVDLFGIEREKLFALDGVGEDLETLPAFLVEVLGRALRPRSGIFCSIRPPTPDSSLASLIFVSTCSLVAK